MTKPGGPAAIAALLSFNGGFADTAAFLGLSGLFVSHVTGNFVTLGAALVLGSHGIVNKILALPEFILVIALARLAGASLRARNRPVLRILLGAEVILMFAFFALAVWFGPFPDADSPAALLAGFAGIAAMALQNTCYSRCQQARDAGRALPVIVLIFAAMNCTRLNGVGRMLAKIGIALAAAWLAALSAPAAAAAPETLNVLGIEMTIKLDAEKTGGAMAVIESVVAPGGGPPMHIHSKEDELFYVLEGRFKLWHGDMVLDVGPGDVAHLRRNGRHTYQNVGPAPGRLLTIITPAGFEGFFREVAKRGLSAPKDMAELNALAGEYGLQFVGPPPRTGN